jgi:hypothetical protein
LSIAIDRWSTAAERDQLVLAISEYGPDRLLETFRDVGRIGTMYWPGGLDYTVRYAWRSQRPDGGADVVLVLDRPVWLWWNPSVSATPYNFAVVQMRLGRNDDGEGRVSVGVPVAGDKTLGVVISDFDQAPALLADVRRDAGGTN